jgi:hypothetical protein
MPAQPTHPAPTHPPASTPTPKAAAVADDDAPPKYKRPLPKPGDKDYVTGQPVDDAEADKVEKEVADKHAAAKAAAKAVSAKHDDPAKPTTKSQEP